MNYKRISLLILFIIGLVLWLTLKVWLPFLLGQLPAIEKRTDLIQAIESVMNLIILGVNGITAYILWLTRSNPKTNLESKQFLHQTPPAEILARLGVGGKVQWIDRGASSISDLHNYGKLIIVGRMKSGKTREALELLQRAVAEDLVLPNRIFEPSPNLRSASLKVLQEGLREELDFGLTALLFIDDFPHHFYGMGLEQLSETLDIMRTCKGTYVIATASVDQLTDSHKAWLAKQGFQIIELPDMSKNQIERLAYEAAKTFNIRFDRTAMLELFAYQDGTPELLLMSFRHLKAEGISKIDDNTAYRLAARSLQDAWAEVRRYVSDRSLGSNYLFEALALFQSAGVDAYTTLVSRFAFYLWNMDRGAWHAFGRKKSHLRQTLVYLANFDIVMQDMRIIYPEGMVQRTIHPETARERLATFLEKDQKFLRDKLPFLFKDANIYSQALLAIYVNKKWAIEDTELSLSIQPLENCAVQEADTAERNYLRLSVCGHAKHGKSTLAGRLMYELRAIPSDLLSNNDRDASLWGKDFNKYSMVFLRNRPKTFARINGRLDDQSRTVVPVRGNIDLGRSSVTLIDTPGFSRYLDSIIHGISLSDQAIVVVDATRGVAHGTIVVCRVLKSFDIPILAFCITKMDLVDYSQSRYEEIKKEVEEALILSLGLNVETPIIPLSALKENDLPIQNPDMNTNMPWYQGDHLLNLLHENKAATHPIISKPTRFVVNGASEALFPPGVGTVLVGVLESGSLAANQELVIEPQSIILKKDICITVRSVHQAKGVTDYKSLPVNEAKARSIVAVNVPAWSLSEAKRLLSHGGVFGTRDSRPRVVKSILARVTFFETTVIHSEKEYIFLHGGQNTSGKLKAIASHNQFEWNISETAYAVSSGDMLNVEIEFSTPFCIEAPSDFYRLSRFVLREHMNIVAYGEFIQQLE